MDTRIHIYGPLSNDISHYIKHENTLNGNRDQDFGQPTLTPNQKQWQIVKRVAELDAIFTHLYGLNTEDLRYILAPEDVCGKGCINETFRVLKDNEIRQYGEYRTKRLVLEAWNKFGFDN